MYIYKLKYKDKKTAITNLLKKEVYKEVTDLNNNIVLAYGDNIKAVVEIGLIVLKNETYDDNFKKTNEATYADGYHYDVISDNIIDFGKYEIKVNNQKHKFYGL